MVDLFSIINYVHNYYNTRKYNILIDENNNLNNCKNKNILNYEQSIPLDFYLLTNYKTFLLLLIFS